MSLRKLLVKQHGVFLLDKSVEKYTRSGETRQRTVGLSQAVCRTWMLDEALRDT